MLLSGSPTSYGMGVSLTSVPWLGVSTDFLFVCCSFLQFNFNFPMLHGWLAALWNGGCTVGWPGFAGFLQTRSAAIGGSLLG